MGIIRSMCGSQWSWEEIYSGPGSDKSVRLEKKGLLVQTIMLLKDR